MVVFLISLISSHSLNQRKQIANFRLCSHKLHALYYYSTLYTYTDPCYTLIMAKGKNHDRKANPGFGKTNGKANSSSAGNEFTLKRVKGDSNLKRECCTN